MPDRAPRRPPGAGRPRRPRTRSRQRRRASRARWRSRCRTGSPAGAIIVSKSRNDGRRCVSTRAFATVSSYSAPAERVPGDPAADPVGGQTGRGVLDRGADRDVEPRAGARRRGRRHVADGAAVDAAGRVLQVGDDPHRRHLGSPGDRTAREQGPEDRRAGRSPVRARPRPSSSAAKRSRSARPRTRRATAPTPSRATRPMSLRSRSTIIAFSARSFSDACRASRRARSSASHRPRDVVPFIGRVLDRVAVDPEEQLG